MDELLWHATTFPKSRDRLLQAYPRQNGQNGLALALRELGRIERTIFTLKWLQEPALRRRVSAGLNKGEARKRPRAHRYDRDAAAPNGSHRR